jgi:voltage-gated potassium channel Kch
VIPQDIAATLVASVALSMALTPLLMILYERVVMPRVGTREAGSREADAIEEDNPVIIAGYGRFGQIVGRLLMSSGLKATVLDVDSDQVDLLRRFGTRVYYGDASRHDLLESAGAARAKVLVLAMDEPEKVLELVHTARKHFPNLTLFARARGRRQAFDLIEAGVEHVFRETLDTSLRVGVEVMRSLGFRAYQAHRAARTFRRMDEKILIETIEHRHDEKALTSFVRQGAADLERVMSAQVGNREKDPGWDVESLRVAAKEQTFKQGS